MSMKVKGDSILDGLNPEQRSQVDKWLFDENGTYSEVAERCGKELQVEVSPASVGRYYRREYARRAANRFERSLAESEEVLKLLEEKKDSARGYRLLLRLAEHTAVNEALKPEKECDFRKVGYLFRAIVAARREATVAGKLALERERFESDFL
jgi:hypothetical protein